MIVWQFLVVLIITTISVKCKTDVVVTLNETNWKDVLKDEWMVEFFAPWCPACKGLEETWRKYAIWGRKNNVKIGQVDVTASPGLSGRFMVTALPTIYHVRDAQFRQYRGSRDQESFINFIVESKWQQIEPVSYWKAPNSITMTMVSSFFKLSQLLRHVHSKLMDDFGLPTWGSYLIFAIVTIIIGALLGLVMVFLIDLLYPPKRSYSHHKKQEVKLTKGSDDELRDEDIKDDLVDDFEITKPIDKSKSSSPSVAKKRRARVD